MVLFKFAKRNQVVDAERYEQLYKNILESKKENELGLSSINLLYRKPYNEYYNKLRNVIVSSDKVLELGSGTGIHTNILCDLSNKVYALDISDSALKLCHLNTKGRAICIKGSIDAIPFESDYFDVIVSAGSLSYSNWEKLKKELIRTLKPNGSVVFVDSLNNNPIYIVNRLFHVLKKNRTLATVIRIPTSKKINKFSKQFANSEIVYFDQFVWLRKMRITKFKFIEKTIVNMEKLKFFQRLAFKFVFVGNGLKKY